MALNPNIILGLRSPKIDMPDPAEQYAKGLHLKGLMAQQELSDQAVADDRSNRDAFAASGGDSSKYLQALASGGNYKAYQAAQKAELDRQKAAADIAHVGAQTGQANATAGKTAQETRFAAADQHARQVVNVQTPQDIVAYVDSGIASGVFPKEGRETMLQKAAQAPSIEAWKQQQMQLAIPVLEKFKQEAENSRNAATNQTHIITTGMTNDTTRRGQNMVDARARDAVNEGKTQIVQSDNGPVIVNKATGAGRAVMGPDGQPLPGVTKPLNDSQSKALLFGTRAQEAHKILEQLSTEGTNVSIPGSRTPVIGGVINALSPENRQMLDQAKRDFMTAILRRESGASISSGEFETADKQYFPQSGDSQKTMQQKARNRDLAVKGILVEVPEKQRGAITPPTDIHRLPSGGGGKVVNFGDLK
jgi:hypothetical protein